MVKAVIFDLDGVLIESEIYFFKAEVEVFKRNGINITEEAISKYLGLKIDPFITEVEKRSNKKVDHKKVTKEMPEALAQILQDKREQAKAMMEMARAANRHNDDASVLPGLVAYFTREGFEKVARDCEDKGQPLDSDSVEELETGAVAVLLPEAAYAIGGDGCEFYLNAELVQATGELRVSNPLMVSEDDLVRIEGFTGEVWQNWGFTPAGQAISQ